MDMASNFTIDIRNTEPQGSYLVADAVHAASPGHGALLPMYLHPA